MSALLAAHARLLVRSGIRHHVDRDEGVIRIVFLTRCYRNLRGERLAIVTLAATADGRACHASIERAFAVGDDPAATCLTACRLARQTPEVAVVVDHDATSISIGVSTIVEGSRLTAPQLLAMIDTLVMTAEDWHGRIHSAEAIRSLRASRPARRPAM